MSYVDYLVFAAYMCGVLGIGFYYFRRNRSTEDYYVGDRSIKAHHVGLSIVATDVGGAFQSDWEVWASPWACLDRGCCSPVWWARG